MRDVSPDVLAELLSPSFRTVQILELDHPAGMVRVNSSLQNIDWNGNTFVALGKMGRVSGVKSTTAIRTQEVSIDMVGPLMDADSLAIAQDENIQGRTAALRQAFLTTNGQVIEAPIFIADITMDVASVSESDGNQTLQISGYLTMFAARNGKAINYSNERQQARFPGDTGFDRLAGLADKVA